MTERFFIDNRRKLAARLEEGSAAVLFAGKAPLKRGDEYYPFSPDVAALRAANPDASASVPVELVTASASGLDNNITPQAAAWQIPRVAKARNLSVEQLTQLIAKYSQQPLVKYIGQPVVNIVELNLALDKLDE